MAITARIRQEGDCLLAMFEDSGKSTVLQLHWQTALELAELLTAQARIAEAFAKAEQIAHDSAILIRAGAPIILSDDEKIQEEAKKQAQWDRELRRAMPSVPTSEAFGALAINTSRRKH